jgi:hypothetical protein
MIKQWPEARQLSGTDLDQVVGIKHMQVRKELPDEVFYLPPEQLQEHNDRAQCALGCHYVLHRFQECCGNYVVSDLNVGFFSLSLISA